MKPEKEKWLLLFLLSLIWGSSFILIKKALITFNPYQVGALRVLIAGILLSPIAILNFKKFPLKDAKYIAIAAFCGNFIPMFLYPIAETKISSSIAGIVNSMMPIFVIIVGAIFWKSKTSVRQIIGIIISFVGVLFMMNDGKSGSETPVLHLGLVLFATVLYAVSTTTAGAKLQAVPAKLLSSFVFFYMLFIPSLTALLLSGFFQEFDFSKEKWTGLGYVGMLSVFGTGLAMMLQYRLMNLSNALFASIVTLLMPIVAVIWGVLDGETLSVFQILGGIIILSGLIFLRKNKPKA